MTDRSALVLFHSIVAVVKRWLEDLHCLKLYCGKTSCFITFNTRTIDSFTNERDRTKVPENKHGNPCVLVQHAQ